MNSQVCLPLVRLDELALQLAHHAAQLAQLGVLLPQPKLQALAGLWKGDGGKGGRVRHAAGASVLAPARAESCPAAPPARLVSENPQRPARRTASPSLPPQRPVPARLTTTSMGWATGGPCRRLLPPAPPSAASPSPSAPAWAPACRRCCRAGLLRALHVAAVSSASVRISSSTS